MKLAALLFVVVLIIGAAIDAMRKPARAADCEYGAFGCGHQEQHHEYKGWKTKTGGSCCNNDDCRPVRARLDDYGWQVWIPEFQRWVPVPAFAVGDPDRFGDGRSHVCSSKPGASMTFHIYCFSPTGSKS